MHWARRACKICDPQAAPARLNESRELGKFIENVPPGILDELRDAHGRSRTLRTFARDKASHMVAPRARR